MIYEIAVLVFHLIEVVLLFMILEHVGSEKNKSFTIKRTGP